MYKVVGTTNTRAFRVMWVLEELNQPYELVAAAPQSEGVTTLNPSGKVPVLIDDMTPVTDSTAIIQYLADRHGRLTYKAGTLDRARQDSLTQFLLDEYDAILWTAARHTFILPEELRVSGIKDTLQWEFQRSQTVLKQRTGNGPFLMGETMTVPDIILTHCLSWALEANFPIMDCWLNNYWGAMCKRPAYIRVFDK